MLRDILDDPSLNFVQRNQEVAEVLRQNRDLQRQIYEHLRARFELEVNKRSASDQLHQYSSGNFRGILPISNNVIDSPMAVRHSIKSDIFDQRTILIDTEVEFAAFSLLNSLGIDTPSYLVLLQHESLRNEFYLQMPLPNENRPLSLYHIVANSQLLPDLSDRGRLKVEEVYDSKQWKTDDHYVHAVVQHLDRVESILARYGVSLVLSGPEHWRKYSEYASWVFSCVDDGGMIEKLVFGDLQKFRIVANTMNLHSDVDTLFNRMGYKPEAPVVNLDVAIQ